MGIYGRDAKGGGDGVIMFQYQNITLINGDCMDYMAALADKAFSLAVVDPPYGIKRDGQAETFTKNPKHKRKWYEQKGWDNEIPKTEYFSELLRISKNQIIWGANYFTQHLPPSMGWIFWDKGQVLSMSDGELAFTSFQVALRKRVINRVEILKDGAIHPTQKPVALYRWLLTNYASPGDTILDTHLGSGSSAIAAYELGFEFVGIELDTDYYNAAVERFKKRLLQPFLPMSFNRQAKQIELKI